MELQQAIEIFENMKNSAERNKNNYSMYGGNPECAEKEIEACNIAIKLIKKEINNS